MNKVILARETQREKRGTKRQRGKEDCVKPDIYFSPLCVSVANSPEEGKAELS
jgi:hypothetical protein